MRFLRFERNTGKFRNTPVTFNMDLAESPARVIHTGKSANDIGKSAGPLQFYIKEILRICQNEILFWRIRRRERRG